MREEDTRTLAPRALAAGKGVHEIVTFSECNGVSAVLADSRSVIGAARAGEASFCFKARSATGQAGRASG